MNSTMHRNRPFLAFTLRLGAAFTFATLLMLVKYAGQTGIAVPEVMFWRQFITVPALLGWLILRGELHLLRTQRLGTHARRAGLGMFNMLCNFGSVMMLPLAVSTTLSFTTPLFAVLIGAWVLRHPTGPWRWAAVVLGFAGIVIIAQPSGEPVSMTGAGIALFSALLIAVIQYQIRDLARTEHSIATVFYFSAFGAAMTALAMPFFMTHHSLWQWEVLLATGLAGIAYQTFLVVSLRYGAVASVLVMDYSQLIWATIYGWLIWHRAAPAEIWVGAPLIVAAGLIIAWREHLLLKKTSVSEG